MLGKARTKASHYYTYHCRDITTHDYCTIDLSSSKKQSSLLIPDNESKLNALARFSTRRMPRENHSTMGNSD